MRLNGISVALKPCVIIHPEVEEVYQASKVPAGIFSAVFPQVSALLRSHFATVAQTERRLYVWGCVFTLAATAYTVLATVQVTKHSMANGAWISNSCAVWYMVALMWGIGGAIIWGWWNQLRRWHGGMESSLLLSRC